MTQQHADATLLTHNMSLIAEKSARVMQAFMARQIEELSTKDVMNTPLDPLNLSSAISELYKQFLQDPAAYWQKQMGLWHDYITLWQHTTEQMLGEQTPPLLSPDRKDRRFSSEAWNQNIGFDFLKQSYLLTARWVDKTLQDASTSLDPHDARKLSFYTRQFVDALSPSNFLMTNPEVLQATLDSNGDNLVRGLDNLLRDIEHGKGKLRISTTDYDAFKVGTNLATTSGKVVYQNALMELIQYAPSTPMVRKTPLLLVPAWINKFYIFDLQSDNSMIKWLVDQGHTVFVISWVNPDERHSDKTFDDYMTLGPLAAMEVIKQRTGEPQLSIIGYCLGGTLLAITLAWLEAHGKADTVLSATFLTTMVDFAEAGELSIFIDDEQLEILESRMSQTGYLEGEEMATTFNMLRSNDMIWSFVVNNYLLGKERFPFDLLFWNSDATRMPARMHSFYLRNMYQKNLLVSGKLTIANTPIDLRSITTPCYLLSTIEDHIAPWTSTYAATQIYAGPKRFVLAASGHIAGVINAPKKQKYHHWLNDALPVAPSDWLKHAQQVEGSWWPDWHRWQSAITQEETTPRSLEASLPNAPGSYVKVMS